MFFSKYNNESYTIYFKKDFFFFLVLNYKKNLNYNMYLHINSKPVPFTMFHTGKSKFLPFFFKLVHSIERAHVSTSSQDCCHKLLEPKLSLVRLFHFSYINYKYYKYLQYQPKK